MPFQGGRYLPPIATPILSTYQKDFICQSVTPQKSFKYRSTGNLPPINYSRHRTVSTESKYSTEFQGSFGPPAPSAKPLPYEYPSKDPFGTSTYRANFRKSNDPKQGTLPTSPLRKNNPHPQRLLGVATQTSTNPFSMTEQETKDNEEETINRLV